MTVSTSKRVKRHVGNGVTTQFPYDFYIPNEASLEVYLYDSVTGVNQLLNPSVYSVTGIGDANFGEVIYPLSGSPITSTQTLTIRRVVEYTQNTSIRNQTGFFPEVIEDALDHLTFQTQQNAEELSRAIVAPLEEETDMTLPSKTKRASKVLAFDSDGQLVVLSQLDKSADTVTATGTDTPRSLAEWAKSIAVKFDNVSSLKAASDLPPVVETLGYYTPGDGGGTTYWWDSASTDGDDGGSVIAPDGGGTGRWKPLPMWGLTPRNFGAKGNGTDSDEAAFNNCQAYYENLGGGIIEVPKGDYPVAIEHNGPGIWWRCEPGTILRAAGSKSVYRVNATVTGKCTISDADIRGQELAQEGVVDGSGFEDTRALHCVEIRGPGVSVVRCKTRAARYDCLYGAVVGWADFHSIDTDWGDSGRNSVSIVEGNGWFFSGGLVWNEGKYKGGGHSYTSLYLFDIEPTSTSTGASRIHISDVRFLVGSPVSGANQIIIGWSYTADDFSHVTIDKCYLGVLPGSAGSICTIRINPAVSSGPVKGVSITRTTCEGRLFANPAPAVLQYSRISDVTLGHAAFFDVSLGDGCIMENVRRTDGVAVNLSIVPGAKVIVRNVEGQVDRVPARLSPEIITDGTARVERHVKAITVSETGSWTPILTIGTRGSYVIRLMGSDASDGTVGISQAELRASVSNNYVQQATPAVFHVNGGDIAMRWATASNGDSSDSGRRTVEILPDSSAANQWVVEVVIYTRHNQGTVTWLV